MEQIWRILSCVRVFILINCDIARHWQTLSVAQSRRFIKPKICKSFYKSLSNSFSLSPLCVVPKLEIVKKKKRKILGCFMRKNPNFSLSEHRRVFSFKWTWCKYGLNAVCIHKCVFSHCLNTNAEYTVLLIQRSIRTELHDQWYNQNY